MEVMEWREDIEDAQAEQDEAVLAALHGKFLGMEEDAVAAVAAAWCAALGYLEPAGILVCKLLCASPLLGPLRKRERRMAVLTGGLLVAWVGLAQGGAGGG